ncbi:MAG: hypothetical protein NTU44_05640 [Bacteroidetes bacterium]|nr:hypothetical protein [Bacteroidota bacterium]
MKKVLFKIIPALAVGFSLILFSCTKKDPTYDVVITVKYLSDTTVVVPGAAVTIEKNDKRVEGVTDNGGMFSATFQLEAIFNVHASIDTTILQTQTLYGSSTIRLQENKTVHRTVFVSP